MYVVLPVAGDRIASFQQYTDSAQWARVVPSPHRHVAATSAHANGEALHHAQHRVGLAVRFQSADQDVLPARRQIQQ